MLHRTTMTTQFDFYKVLSRDMDQKLSGYMHGIQQRYGDPRVYAREQHQMAIQDAAVIHHKAQRTSDLLKEAYEKQAIENRTAHAKRMAKHHSQNEASPHESPKPTPRRKPAPAQPRTSAPPTAAPSQT